MSDTKRPITFIESVLTRPQIYTLTGTYAEAVCFLNGYTSGLGKGYDAGCIASQKGTVRDSAELPPNKQWWALQDALSEDLGVNQAQVFKQFRIEYSTDNEAISSLLERAKALFDTFQKDASPGDDEAESR